MTEPRRVRTQVERDADGTAWRRESDVYAEAGQSPPAWAVPSETLGLCPMVCPDHQRHCDAYGDGTVNNLGHTDPHACSLCDHWRPR